MWPDWAGEAVEAELLLFLRELAECRERSKDEPSVDATCERRTRVSGPLKPCSSRFVGTAARREDHERKRGRTVPRT